MLHGTIIKRSPTKSPCLVYHANGFNKKQVTIDLKKKMGLRESSVNGEIDR